MADVAAAELVNAESDLSHRYDQHGSYYPGLVKFIAGLPDNDPELARVGALLVIYDRGPGRWPDINCLVSSIRYGEADDLVGQFWS